MKEKNMNNDQLLGQVLSNVAAQLRGALGNIQGALENIVPPQAREENRALDENTAILYQSYYRMLRLAGNLSDAAQLGKHELLPLRNGDIVALVRDLCRQAEGVAALKNQKILFLCKEEEHITAFHAAGMERVLLNLLSNAMKFTPKDGEIRVSLSFESGEVVLLVSDTGCGIPEELRETVFDRHLHVERMDPLPYGLGLGLPICHHIVSGHDGQIEVLSLDGGGTHVRVAIPDCLSSAVQVNDFCFDYAGGFNHILVELSDALPARAFLKEYMD